MSFTLLRTDRQEIIEAIRSEYSLSDEATGEAFVRAVEQATDEELARVVQKAGERIMEGADYSDALVTAVEDHLDPVDAKPEHIISFYYHGVWREVADPVIDSERRLLSGVERRRDGERTNQFKHYKLSEIGTHYSTRY
jgi:hypothetical protein